MTFYVTSKIPVTLFSKVMAHTGAPLGKRCMDKLQKTLDAYESFKLQNNASSIFFRYSYNPCAHQINYKCFACSNLKC